MADIQEAPMVADELEAEEFFPTQLEADELNRCCFDCGTEGPVWASVSHGIYISIGAAGVHRSLGVRVSRVQSLEMDAWKPLHLRMMQLGGNRRFSEFLQEQGVPKSTPIRTKYNTRAADWYRRNLQAEAEGAAPPHPLPSGTGALPVEGLERPSQVLDEVFAEVPEHAVDEASSFRSVFGQPRSPDPDNNSRLVCRLMYEGFKLAFGSSKLCDKGDKQTETPSNSKDVLQGVLIHFGC